MHYFGTDGIRAKADMLLSSRIPFKLGAALAARGGIVAVGRDVRLSSPAVERQLIEGLCDGGCRVLLCGVLPTPALSYITAEEGADYGIMITASHNPPQYNGLKVFAKGGVKQSSAEEIELDNAVFAAPEYSDCKSKADIAVVEGAERQYKRRVVSLFEKLDGLKVVLDCANGCMATLAPDVFESVGATVRVQNGNRDGAAVNVDCGAAHVDNFLSGVQDGEIGFSFDGDGDRAIAVYDGKIFDGDAILYTLATDMQSTNTLKNNAVCGTVMTNGALEKELAYRGITLFRSDVGDKFVLEKMREVCGVLGGETSGHIITPKAPTGDGLITALLIAEHLNDKGSLPHFEPYPSASFNMATDNPSEYAKNEDFLATAERAKQVLGENGRLIVRPSGTEPAVRITIECFNGDLEYAKTIKNLFLFKNPQK